MVEFRGKSLLVTGGTGSFGQAFVENLLATNWVDRIIIYSRDEMKQWNMASKFKQDARLRFFLGDVRDKRRLDRAMRGVDLVVHAAATKIVPLAEYNPMEAVKTNVLGAMNVIDSALDHGVEKVVALSTDKASSPVNLYGATKLTSDKLFISSNSYSGDGGTRFSVVRYGNVMGSRGSLIPLLLGIKGPFPITDERMTRFMITLDSGVDLVLTAFDAMRGGELFVKKIPSMNVVEIARAVDPSRELQLIGVRPGEKLHEQMISPEESFATYDFGHYFKVLPVQHEFFDAKAAIGGTLVREGFSYSSDSNDEWMETAWLRSWIARNKSNFLAI